MPTTRKPAFIAITAKVDSLSFGLKNSVDDAANYVVLNPYGAFKWQQISVKHQILPGRSGAIDIALKFEEAKTQVLAVPDVMIGNPSLRGGLPITSSVGSGSLLPPGVHGLNSTDI